jgi:hypothetical protein
LKIEREWRDQLEVSSRQDKETLANLQQEVTYLEKVAGVSHQCRDLLWPELPGFYGRN